MPNPTPHELLTWLGVTLSGGEVVIENDFRNNPPTWFAVTSPTEFRRSNLAGLREWIEANYDQVWPEPGTSLSADVMLLRYKGRT
jgi:hypothetical protein